MEERFMERWWEKISRCQSGRIPGIGSTPVTGQRRHCIYL